MEIKMLNEGIDAPNFSLRCTNGNYHNLAEFLGKKVILYFYPRDDTSGCTTEACGFRDEYKNIRNKNTVIIGISPDSVISHIGFKEKYHLPFMLLSDPEYLAARKYDILKSFLGFKIKKIIRSTFLIDEKGKIIKAFPEVNVSTHSKELLNLI